ncbi:MAG TPA: hypothetical protein VFN67_26485 [Polyangiales bacterium]|nr:hypothetical protein [Polyangiales bacterium]
MIANEKQFTCPFVMRTQWASVTTGACGGAKSGLSLVLDSTPGKSVTLKVSWHGENVPLRVAATLSRDGKRIANAAGALKFRTFTPNGPDCGPTCRQGSVLLDLSTSSSRAPQT